MACVAVNSLVRTIELEFLQPQPRPILLQNGLIPANEDLLQSLHHKLGFLIDLFDENRMDGIQAIKDLETKLRDVAFRVEDEIEFQIVHLYEIEEKEELLAGIAGLFGEKQEEDELGVADLFVEKPQGETTGAQRSWHSLKLGCILEEAIRDIDAIYKELSKVKMELAAAALQGTGNGRKTTTTVVAASTTCYSDGGVDVMMMAGDHQHASHSQPLHSSTIMVGRDNDFQIVKEMLNLQSSRQLKIVSIQGMGGIGKTILAKRLYEDTFDFPFDIRAWVVASQNHNKLQMLTDLLKSMGCVVDSSTKEDQLADQLHKKLIGHHQRYFVVIDDIWCVEAWDSIQTCFPDNTNGSRVLLTTRSAQVATTIGSNNEFSHQMQLLEEGESWNLFRERTSKSLGSEFDMIVRQIVEKCKGLPLAIVVAAGLCSKLHTLDEWENVAEVLNSSATTTIDEECFRILSSSYNHLPHSLKACFLYLSIFPEDKEIHVREIVKLWIAEGLVKASKDMSFDAVARRHIQELKDRNLILVSQPSSCGRKVKTFRMHDLLHSFCVREAEKENLLHIVYGYWTNPLQKDFRWVSIQSTWFDPEAFYYLKNCRSIFFFKRMFVVLNSKFGRLLRVLYNVECPMAYLVHLRCLLTWKVASTILDPFRSWNLQTLSASSVDKVSILEFPQLQHLLSYRGLSDFPIFFHQNMKSICGLIPDQCTKELFTNIPYLKKVEILCCEDGWSDDCINSLAYSHQLQSLHLRCRSDDCIANINHLVCLDNLMKLRFTKLRFEWKAINILSKLPKLKVLRLSCCKCIDEEWELLEEENFDHLIYLEIDSICDLKQWKASDDHFPNLERLVLKRCTKLVKIPTKIANNLKLKSIELDNYCLPSAMNSAKEIEKEQHEQGNENMVVIPLEYTTQDWHSPALSSNPIMAPVIENVGRAPQP